ncbi:MAG: hypothetical protein KatS3mg102_2846 [Planctomycetota bacterium]|nr:MAG: hypothetical protein KatS3mg102_2846 [Planctomycetota bacterium]
MAAGRVFLVGLPGAGKSTVGRRLAERLGAAFADADARIAARAGKSVSAIFAEDGEACFRALEREVVGELCAAAPPLVAALGGGALGEERTRQQLRRAGTVVWLRAPAPVLLARLAAEQHRPLFAGLDAAARQARLAALAAAREPHYRATASLVIETGERAPDELAAEIAARLAGACRVRVELGARSYEVVIEAGGLERLGERVREAGFSPGGCVLVTERTVGRLYRAPALAALQAAGFRPAAVTLPAGEQAKGLGAWQALLHALRALDLDRTTPLVALGGGALTDVAGFAAATYRRGLPWVAVPTTLLGMVDAAIGGKTGINLGGTKNLVGAFHQPRLVLADPLCLRTLAPRELCSGLGEVLKYALIGPEPLWSLVAAGHLGAGWGPDGCSAGDVQRLAELVALCAGCKAEVVAADECEEHGVRQVLNFGHTIGHALEAALGPARITHGEAVVLGMRAALWLSERLGLLQARERARLDRPLAAFPLPPLGAGLEPARVLAHLRLDKKTERGRPRFVLLERRGQPRVGVEVGEALLCQALAWLAAPA